MKILSLVLVLFLSFSAGAASIEPSQAFSTALSVAEVALKEKYSLGKEYRVYEVTLISIGHYSVGSSGQYSVALKMFSPLKSDNYDCTANVTIKKVPFAKQPAGVRILEQVIGDYQIIAKMAGDTSVQCNKL
jgi:hypothetical protein